MGATPSAADVVAMEMVEQVGALSLQARALQLALREAAASLPARRAQDDSALRALVARDRLVKSRLGLGLNH